MPIRQPFTISFLIFIIIVLSSCKKSLLIQDRPIFEYNFSNTETYERGGMLREKLSGGAISGLKKNKTSGLILFNQYDVKLKLTNDKKVTTSKIEKVFKNDAGYTFHTDSGIFSYTIIKGKNGRDIEMLNLKNGTTRIYFNNY